jgi:hypothetical protein
MPIESQNLWINFLLSAGWVAILLVVSVVYRWSKGKPLLQPQFDRPLFLET